MAQTLHFYNCAIKNAPPPPPRGAATPQRYIFLGKKIVFRITLAKLGHFFIPNKSFFIFINMFLAINHTFLCISYITKHFLSNIKPKKACKCFKKIIAFARF